MESLDRQFVYDAVNPFRFHVVMEFSYAFVRCSTSVHALGGDGCVEQVGHMMRPPPTSSMCDLRVFHDDSERLAAPIKATGLI